MTTNQITVPLESDALNEVLSGWEIFGWNKEGTFYIGHPHDRELTVTVNDRDVAFMTGFIHSGTIQSARVIRETNDESGIASFAVVGKTEKHEEGVLLFRLTVNGEENVEKFHFLVNKPVHRLV